jgi:hypothetical protein
VITAAISDSAGVYIRCQTKTIWPSISATSKSPIQTFESPQRSGDIKANKSGSFKQCSQSLARLKDFQKDETGENFESKLNADFEEYVRRW